MRGRLAPLLVFAVYLLPALILTTPAHETLSTRFIGGDTSDVYEMARHVWWFKVALQGEDNVFWHSLLGFPDGFAAVQLWAHPLQFFPMWLLALFMPLALAYNITVLAAMALNGLAMYVLARRLLSGHDPIPPLFAGLVYMVFPVFQGHVFAGHVGLLMGWGLPLFVLCLYDYVDRGGARRLLGAMLCFLLATLGHSLMLFYALLPMALLFALARLYRRDHVGALRVALVALLGCLLQLLFLFPILVGALESAVYSDAGGQVRYSIDLLGIASPSFQNPYWRDIATHSASVLGTNLEEGSSYIGLLGGMLALLGLLSRRDARFWLMVALAAWVLALGPVLKVFDMPLRFEVAGYENVMPLPYAFAMQLPGFELARAPGRFMILFALAFGLLAGWGMLTMWSSSFFQSRRRSIRYILLAVFILFVFQDYRFFAPFPTLPVALPAAIHELRDRQDIRAIFNVPHDDLLAAKEAMYLQTAHGKPLIAGHDARETPVNRSRLTLLAEFHPSLLSDADVDVVILNKARARAIGELESLAELANQRLGEAIYEDERYAIFTVPFRPRLVNTVFAVESDMQSHKAHIFRAQPGWLELNATLEAINRRVNLSLNGALLDSLEVNGKIPLLLPLPIARRGYHSLLIELDPPCPPRIDATLLFCHGVTVDQLDIRVLSTSTIYDPIRIEDDIVLAGFYLPDQADDELAVRFWWRFEAPRSANDVRFVHLLDEAGRLVPGRQDDTSLGLLQAGDELTETVRFDTRFLPAGEYRVLTGWYRLPDAIRYDVLTNVPGAQDDTIQLGIVRVGL
ncbi:MAG: hypothetical protein OXE46_08500 [Chloroflexi bacterium]|nr:hypothetical protein [Chloroflexota bacterium]